MSSGGTRAGEGAPGSRATGATAAVSFGSEEAGTGTGAEAGGGTDATVSSGGTRAGEGAPGSRATGATAAVSFGAEEAGTGTGTEAGGGTDASLARCAGPPGYGSRRPWDRFRDVAGKDRLEARMAAAGERQRRGDAGQRREAIEETVLGPEHDRGPHDRLSTRMTC